MIARARFLALPIGLLLLPACAVEQPEPPAPAAASRVLILGTELLSPAEIGPSQARRIDHVFRLDPADTSSEPLAGFFLRLATDRPGEVKIRHVDLISSAVMPLIRIQAPDPLRAQAASADTTDTAASLPPGVRVDVSAFDGLNFSQQARAELAAGRGVYWQAEPLPDGDPLEHRFGVVLPKATLGLDSALDVYVDETVNGQPLRGDRIELVEDFFYLAAIGDSVVWGNGLLPEDKFTTLVADAIESRTGRKVVRIVRAMSGARILPRGDERACTGACDGEVPPASVSITNQSASLSKPELLDLIIMNGCANDIGLDTILSPETLPDDIRSAAESYCHSAMIELLVQVRELAPTTPIVVTGYYSFISAESDFSSVEEWIKAYNVELEESEDIEGIVGDIRRNSEVFAESANEALVAAVATALAETDSSAPILFVHPGFGARNAVFAPESWLWGLVRNQALAGEIGLGIRLVPEDPLLDYRVMVCLERASIPLLPSCIYSSPGHPNTRGAQAYAGAIVQALTENGLLP